MFAAQKNQEILEPFLSSETIEFHYGKHHMGYANTLNALIKDTEYENLPLEQIIIKSRGNHSKIFNNASQLFNHDFYWKCLKKTDNTPSKKLMRLINSQFNNFDTFREEYISFANALFGSGWSWVIEQNGKLEFMNTSNAENPIGSSANPLCVVDLWEHAYYIDYRNNRSDYVMKIVKNCINWNFCELCLESC